MPLQIITNNHVRKMKYGYELPEKVRGDFDYLSDEEYDSHDFIFYRGRYYDFSEIMPIAENAPKEMQQWDGYSSDSFFSGIVVKLLSETDGYADGEYKIGLYLS